MCIYRANIIQTILYNYHACLFLFIFTATRNEYIITLSTYIYIYIQYLLKTTGQFAQRATIVFACKYLIPQLNCYHYAQAGTFNVII